MLAEIEEAPKVVEHARGDALQPRLKIGPEQGDAHRLKPESGNMGQIFSDLGRVETLPERSAAARGEITETKQHDAKTLMKALEVGVPTGKDAGFGLAGVEAQPEDTGQAAQGVLGVRTVVVRGSREQVGGVVEQGG